MCVQRNGFTGNDFTECVKEYILVCMCVFGICFNECMILSACVSLFCNLSSNDCPVSLAPVIHF